MLKNKFTLFIASAILAVSSVVSAETNVTATIGAMNIGATGAGTFNYGNGRSCSGTWRRSYAGNVYKFTSSSVTGVPAWSADYVNVGAALIGYNPLIPGATIALLTNNTILGADLVGTGVLITGRPGNLTSYAMDFRNNLAVAMSGTLSTTGATFTYYGQDGSAIGSAVYEAKGGVAMTNAGALTLKLKSSTGTKFGSTVLYVNCAGTFTYDGVAEPMCLVSDSMPRRASMLFTRAASTAAVISAADGQALSGIRNSFASYTTRDPKTSAFFVNGTNFTAKLITDFLNPITSMGNFTGSGLDFSVTQNTPVNGLLVANFPSSAKGMCNRVPGGLACVAQDPEGKLNGLSTLLSLPPNVAPVVTQAVTGSQFVTSAAAPYYTITYSNKVGGKYPLSFSAGFTAAAANSCDSNMVAYATCAKRFGPSAGAALGSYGSLSGSLVINSGLATQVTLSTSGYYFKGYNGTTTVSAQDGSTTSVAVGSTLQLVASSGVTGSSAVNVAGGSWQSRNTEIATVNETTGVVTGVSEGTANIVFTALGGNVSGSMDVTVTAACNPEREICVGGVDGDAKGDAEAPPPEEEGAI